MDNANSEGQVSSSTPIDAKPWQLFSDNLPYATGSEFELPGKTDPVVNDADPQKAFQAKFFSSSWELLQEADKKAFDFIQVETDWSDKRDAIEALRSTIAEKEADLLVAESFVEKKRSEALDALREASFSISEAIKSVEARI